MKVLAGKSKEKSISGSPPEYSEHALLNKGGTGPLWASPVTHASRFASLKLYVLSLSYGLTTAVPRPALRVTGVYNLLPWNGIPLKACHGLISF